MSLIADDELRGRRDSKHISPLKKKLIKNIQTVIQNPNSEDIVTIMQLGKKGKDSMENLANYCKNNEKLMAILRQNSSLSQDMFILNLASQFDYVCSPSNAALFNYGDVGDRFYVIIKGEVAILIPQDKHASLTFIEYISYLCNLFKSNEMAILQKCIEINLGVFNVSSDLIEKICKPEKKNIEEAFIESYNDLGVGQGRNNEFKRLLTKSDSIDSLDGRFRRPSKRGVLKWQKEIQIEIDQGIALPLKEYLNVFDFPEQYSYPFSLIRPHLDLGKAPDSPAHNSKLIRKSIVSESLKTSSPYKKPTISFNTEEFLRLQTEKKPVKIFKFINIKDLKSGDIFGEIALQTSKNKRTATIFITQTSHLLYLVKQAFDDTIGEIHTKILTDKIKFLKTYSLFQFYPGSLLYENYYRFFNTFKLNTGSFIFNQSMPITKTYFIRSGVFIVYINASLFQINDYLNKLGHIDEKFTLAVFHNENSEEFNKFINVQRKFIISKLYAGEYAGLDYQMKEEPISLASIECISDTAEVFILENYDFYRLLNDYDNWKFSVTNDDVVAKDEIVAKMIEKNDCDFNPEFNLQDDCLQDIDSTKEAKIGNFLSSFSLHKPKNPVHSSFLNYCKVKRDLIHKRLFEIKRVYLERYMFKTNNVKQTTLHSHTGKVLHPKKSQSSFKPQQTLKFTHCVEPNSTKNQSRNGIINHYPSSISIKTSNQFLYATTYTLKDINKENDEICAKKEAAELLVKQKLFTTKKPQSSNKLSGTTFLVEDDHSKLIVNKNSPYIFNKNEIELSMKRKEYLSDRKIGHLSKYNPLISESSLAVTSSKIVILDSLNYGTSKKETAQGIEVSVLNTKDLRLDNTHLHPSSRARTNRCIITNTEASSVQMTGNFQTLSTTKISKSSTSVVKGPLRTSNSTKKYEKLEFKVLIEKGLSKFQDKDFELLKQIKQQDKQKYRLICSLSDKKKIFGLFESKIKAIQEQSLRNRTYRKEKESLY